MTAVEWLQYLYDNRPESDLLEQDFEQAKQMERDQIKVSYETGWINGDLKKAPRFGEDYYNDEYSKESTCEYSGLRSVQSYEDPKK